MPTRNQDRASADRGLRLGLPKGRMQESVFTLLADAGLRVRPDSRGYRPQLSLPGYEAKILKPHNIIEMLAAGTRDAGFAGADWVAEQAADVVEVLDTGLDAVRLVVAAPPSLLVGGAWPARPLVIASEYERLARRWIESRELEGRFVRSYGATEVFPPEDADAVIDITASGATLRAQNLCVVEELMTSSTRLYAARAAMTDPARRDRIERLAMLLRSVLEARQRVMLEINVDAAQLRRVIDGLPCMREPTIAPLHGDAGFAIKVAVPRRDLPVLIPQIKAKGGTDIIVTSLAQIIP